MLIEPKVRTMLQEEVTLIQNKMMDKVIEALEKHIADYSTFNATTDDIRYILMKLYDEYSETLVHDILLPLDDPGDQRPLNSATFTMLVRRLNKGYFHFVYDISKERLPQIIAERKNNQAANTEEESTTEPSFPEETAGDGE